MSCDDVDDADDDSGWGSTRIIGDRERERERVADMVYLLREIDSALFPIARVIELWGMH